MEIITGVERRRRWRAEDKRRIVAEVQAPGAVFAAVARRHDVSRGQLWNWCRLARQGAFSDGSGEAAFIPMQVMPESAPAQSGGDVAGAGRLAPPRNMPPLGCIEITLPNGAVIRADNQIDVGMLRAAITAARG